MCLIIVSENGRSVNLPDLQVAYENNPDGAGVMWLENDRVMTKRIVPTNFDEVKELAWRAAGFPHAIHLRYCTRGTVTPDNSHPFVVLDKDSGDTHDLTLMHNGTFTWLTPSDIQKKNNESDTAIFAGRLQKNFRENVPSQKLIFENFFDKDVNEKLSRRVSSWNKVVMLANDGRWVFLNKSSGIIRNEMWYSNDYSLKPGYRDQQTKHHGPATASTWSKSYDLSAYDRRKSAASTVSNPTTSTPANTTTSSQKPDYSVSNKNKTSNTVSARNQKGAQIGFVRTTCVENGVYIIYKTEETESYCLIDPDTAKIVNTNNRLGKTERKALKVWLETEARRKTKNRNVIVPTFTTPTIVEGTDEDGNEFVTLSLDEATPS